MNDDDWMFNPGTVAARSDLTSRLAQEIGLIAGAQVTCNQAPLIIEGDTCDGRRYRFRARHGLATLTVTDEEPRTVEQRCSPSLAVESTDEVVELIADMAARLTADDGPSAGPDTAAEEDQPPEPITLPDADELTARLAAYNGDASRAADFYPLLVDRLAGATLLPQDVVSAIFAACNRYADDPESAGTSFTRLQVLGEIHPYIDVILHDDDTARRAAHDYWTRVLA